MRTVDLEGDDLRVIHRSRQLARLVSGHPLSVPDADTFVLDCWHQRADGRKLVARARQSPPAPLERTPPSWCGLPDPAARVLGPWCQPRDLAHALRLLEAAQVARDSRVVLLGQAFDLVAARALHREMGFRSLRALAEVGLDCSVRTLERQRALARDLVLLPDLARAIAQGLDLARARLVASIACEDTVQAWIRVARNTGLAELGRGVALAGGRPGKQLERRVLEGYQRAMRLASGLADQAEAHLLAEWQGRDATRAGAPAPGGHATEAGAAVSGRIPVFVSLNAAWAPPPAPRFDRVHVDLPTAARCFLDNVRIDPQRGFGKVKERDHYTCRNPECGCRNLRVQAHHVHPRSLGGSDLLDNGVCVCKCCHLRLIHTGRISVTRVGDALVWRYPGRVVVAL